MPRYKFPSFPFFVLLLGLSLLLAALGVYIRDIQQVMGTVTAMMLFVSPVLYSIAALPDWLKYIIYLNPISIPVETFRSVMLFGHLPDWSILALYSVVACGVFILGSAFFTRCRSGFADVI